MNHDALGSQPTNEDIARQKERYCQRIVRGLLGQPGTPQITQKLVNSRLSSIGMLENYESLIARTYSVPAEVGGDEFEIDLRMKNLNSNAIAEIGKLVFSRDHEGRMKYLGI